MATSSLQSHSTHKLTREKDSPGEDKMSGLDVKRTSTQSLSGVDKNQDSVFMVSKTPLDRTSMDTKRSSLLSATMKNITPLHPSSTPSHLNSSPSSTCLKTQQHTQTKNTSEEPTRKTPSPIDFNRSTPIAIKKQSSSMGNDVSGITKRLAQITQCPSDEMELVQTGPAIATTLIQHDEHKDTFSDESLEEEQTLHDSAESCLKPSADTISNTPQRSLETSFQTQHQTLLNQHQVHQHSGLAYQPKPQSAAISSLAKKNLKYPQSSSLPSSSETSYTPSSSTSSNSSFPFFNRQSPLDRHHSHPHPVLRRHSLHVSVRRRASSVEQTISSQNFNGIPASPAVSFLSQLAEKTSQPQVIPGVYHPGDEVGPYVLTKEIGSGSFSTVFAANSAGSSQPSGHPSHLDYPSTTPVGTPTSVPTPVAVKVIAKSPSCINTASPASSFSTQSPASHGRKTSYDTASPVPRLEKIVSVGSLPEILEKETSIWSRLDHPNIVKLHDIVESDDAVFVISEIAQGGCLYNLLNAQKQKYQEELRKQHEQDGGQNQASCGWGAYAQHDYADKTVGLKESEAKRLFKDIVKAVKYMHDLGIVHRDIKCENILLVERNDVAPAAQPPTPPPIAGDMQVDSGPTSTERASHIRSMLMNEPTTPKQEDDPCNECQAPVSPIMESERYSAKLADFGLSDYFNSQEQASSTGCEGKKGDGYCVGSLHYCSPEEIRQTSVGKPCSDVWSLGCVLYAMLTGTLPFADDYLPRLQTMIINGRYDKQRLVDCNISKEAMDLIEYMLAVKVEDRYTMDGILSSPWLNG